MNIKPIERPGIYPRWSLKSKSFYANYLKWRDTFEPINRHDLEYYIQNGVTPPNPYDSPEEQANPRRPGWKHYLTSKLGMYAVLRLPDFEMKSVMAGEPFDTALALRAFAGMYTRLMINGPLLYEVPFIALGVVIGCQKEAFRMARFLCSFKQRGGEDIHPIFHFMVRILADYLGESPRPLTGEPLAEPITNALFDLWREPDPDALVSVCLAACDFHTQRCRISGDFDFFEFSNSFWNRTPIEILLLFKLRQLLGLQNPKIDHPIMNTPLGKLPEQVVSFSEIANGPEGENDLLCRVRRRMMQDGFDEEEVYARWEQYLAQGA